MDPGPDVNFLLQLSPIEQAAISIFCPSVQVFRLGIHSQGSKGHSIAYIQNVSELSSVLPLKPENLPVLVILPPKKPNEDRPHITDKQFTVRKNILLDSLKWLKKNNPEYKNIIIEENNLEQYEISNDILQNPPIVHADQNFSRSTNPQENPETEATSTTSVDPPIRENTMEDNIRNAAQNSRNDFGPQPEDGEINSSPLQWPTRDKQLASEFEHGYWSKAFPVLFPWGQGDITKRNEHPYQVPLLEWIQFLIQSYRRFAKHHLFVFVAASQYRRHKAMTISNVYAEKRSC